MKKSKIPLPIWVVGLIIVITIVITSDKKEDTKIISQANKYYKMHTEIEKVVQNIPKNEENNKKNVFLEENNASQEQVEIPEKSEDNSEKVNEEVIEDQEELYKDHVENADIYQTRLTSYYPAEDTDCTGSGLCSWDFQVNENGWYTYNGKLVVATATNYLLKYGFSLANGVHTYNYYDTLILNIDGVDYEAIVLDSCGSSMQTDRVDLFVSGAEYIKDTIIEVRR